MEEKERKTGKFKLAGGSTGLLSARVQSLNFKPMIFKKNKSSLIISMFSNEYDFNPLKLD